MDIYNRLPKDLRRIIDEMVHQINFRNVILSIDYMSHCFKCDLRVYMESNIFVQDYLNELGRLKWRLDIPYICECRSYL